MSTFSAQTRQVLERVLQGKLSKARAARRLGVSRKTVYGWLKHYQGSGIRNKELSKASKKDILRIVIANPRFGPKKIAQELTVRGKRISTRAVWLVLKGENLAYRSQREVYALNFRTPLQAADATFPGYLRLNGEARKRLIEEVLLSRERVGKTIRAFGVSRKTFAKWKKRYQEAAKRNENIVLALSDQHPTGSLHPRGVNEKAIQVILDLIVSNPSLSSHKISAKLRLIGNHGVQRVLERNNLNHYALRLAYSQARRIAKPVPIFLRLLNRVRLVWEEFIPTLAPAPPVKFFKPFFISSALAFLISSGVIYWTNILSGVSFGVALGLLFATIALLMGSVFFLYSMKYYFTLAIVLSFAQQSGIKNEESGIRNGKIGGFLGWLLGLNGGGPASTTLGVKSGLPRPQGGGLEPNLDHVVLKRHPYLSVHIPLYNEKNVVERVLASVTAFEYPNYEVIIADDSTDETTPIITDYISKNGRDIKREEGSGFTLMEAEVRPGVVLKHLHRTSRSGFKGGALKLALEHTDKKAEFITVFDADFVPYPDTLTLFLKYFQVTAGTLDFSRVHANQPRMEIVRMNANEKNIRMDSQNLNSQVNSHIAAVQGYQWHVLNKSENWITRGVRSEYAGNYVIERSGAEIYQGLKMIAGSVYMVRRDVLEAVGGWGTSITEDFELTLRLYERGYKVVYTPYIQAPAECVSTIRRLVRQRMRWAEGHSHNIRRMFMRLMFGKWETNNAAIQPSSHGEHGHMVKWSDGQMAKQWLPSPLSLSEKLEFLYLSPYYLQAFLFIVGTLSWLISETIFHTALPFWTALWGWSLVLTNFLALPLVNAVGLFLEEAEERDFIGLLSFIALSYIVVPFQAYAAVKGFLEKEEGPWFRTPKTGHITDILTRGRFYRFIFGILGRPQPAASMVSHLAIQPFNNPYLALTSANNRFDSPPVPREEGFLGGFFNFNLFGRRGIKLAYRYVFTKGVLAGFLSLVMMLNYMAFLVYDTEYANRNANEKARIDTNKENKEENISMNSQNSNSLTNSHGSSGQTITTINDTVNTNLAENPSALRLAQGKLGVVYAAESEETYRWTVDFKRGTTYSFGLQEPQGIRPVVKMVNKDGWFVKYEPVNRNHSAIQPSNNNSIATWSDGQMVTEYVDPKVDGNSIEWTLENGVVARYTALKDRIKADYIVGDRLQVTGNPSTSSGQARLEFIVNYNDAYSGDTPEEAAEGVKQGRGYMSHELLPDGSIAWLGENGMPVFEMPRPVINNGQIATWSDGQIDNHSTIQPSNNSDVSFSIQKLATATSLLSINIPPEILSEAEGPLTIDPVTIDSAATANATAYGNGRKILRDAWGNLIVVCDCGTGDDNLWYKNYDASSWTDAAFDLDTVSNQSSLEIAADLDSSGDIRIVFRYSFDDGLNYKTLVVTRDGNNKITSVSNPIARSLDTSGEARRPSLIVANKGEGAGKEKVAVAWAMNSASGGTKRGEIRFLQCDVADACTTAGNWKNASEEKDGSGTCSDTDTAGSKGLPNAVTCKGAADRILTDTSAHTNHHGVLTQVPGRPQRTPTNAKWDDTGIFVNLTNAIDDNTGTNASIGTLSTIDYLYIGDDNKFSKVIFNIGTGNTTDAGSPTPTYWNGSAWADVSNFVDNNQNSTGIDLNEDGSWLFDEPSNWTTTAVDGATKYWIRYQPLVDPLSAGTTINELDITDRHSKDLLIVAEIDATEDLRAAYVIWGITDSGDQSAWEDDSSDTANPWIEDTGGTSSALDNESGQNATNNPLTATVDLINNAVYVAYIKTVIGADTTVKRSPNTLSMTASASWSDTGFPDVTEAADIVLSLTSDQSDIYLFYNLDPQITRVTWRKCSGNAGPGVDICNDSADWGSENTVDNGVNTSHPQAVVSKAFGDTVAIDVVYVDGIGSTPVVEYERHYVDMNDATEVVAASGDDAFHRDCETGTDDQGITGTTVKLGREVDDASCSPTTVESENHVGFRFTTVNVAQGARISSAYLDFRVSARTGGGTAIAFTIYGEDVDSSAIFAALTDCTAPCSGAVGERTRTTTSTAQSIDFVTNSYRIDVTDLVQEIVCRGAANAQPCVGNFNGAGTWAANNNLSLLLIKTGAGAADNFASITAQDDTGTLMLDPTLQINCAGGGCGTGNPRFNYSMGVLKPPTGSGTTGDLAHPMSSIQFGQVGTNDTSYASVSASLVPSASDSATPIYMFKQNNSNNNNTDEIQVTVVVRSSIPAKSYGGPHSAGRTIYLQIYRDGTTNDWETITSDTTGVADTDITVSGSRTTNLTQYYRTSTPGGSCITGDFTDCWAFVRVYQDAAPEANQILFADLVSFVFVPERVLWLLPIAIFLPRILPYINRRLRRRYAVIKHTGGAG